MKTSRKILLSVGVVLILTLAVAGYFFWSKKFHEVGYVIPGVPYYGIYNHIGKAAEINPSSPASVVSIVEYWNPEKNDFSKISEFFRQGERGSYINNQKIKEFFEQQGSYSVKEEKLEIKDLGKYINSDTKTPLFLFLSVDSRQPYEVTFHPANLLIGLKEKEKKIVLHDYWLGNNYEISFDEFNKRWGRMKPEERNMYIVVQPINFKEKINEIKNRGMQAYPERTQTMKKTEQMFKDYSIGLGAVRNDLTDVAAGYFLRVQSSPDFEEFFPPLFKVLLWQNMAEIFLAKDDFDNALQYADKSIESDHDLNDPNGDWPGYDHAGKPAQYEGVVGDPYRVLGDIYRKQGDLAKAKENFQKALDIAPGYRAASESLQAVEEELKK